MDKLDIDEVEKYKDELARAKRDLSVVYEVSNAMRTSLELNRVLHIILTGVTSHTGLGFNRAILFLVNYKEFCLEPKMAIGPESGEHAKKIWDYISQSQQRLDDLIKYDKIEYNTNKSFLYQSIKNLKIPLKDGNRNLLCDAFNSGIPMHITQEKISNYIEDILLQHFHTKELIIMPLKAKDKVNGIIIADNLYTQKTITEDDLKIFMMLANQAGLAIENSQLYEKVKYKSHTDSITDLWNHGFFQNQLSEEIIFHTNEKKSNCLIMVDIDNFKGLNDSLGHQTGDLVLMEIATILKDSSRENDYVCRYGGDEFAIILTQTTKDQGIQMAERIRKSIEQHDFSQFSSDQKCNLTVSIGLASFPEDANNKKDLIAIADKAMYKAKFGGKNQICLA